MSENVNGKTIFSLLEVTRSIQQTINDRYKSSYWIKAEMNKLNLYKHSGHCYPELVEKLNGKIIAQIKANIWKDDFININNMFIKVLKEPLKDGIKILFLANISFDSTHGLALRIIDIDPGYTLGDLETEKQETIRKLQDEEVFDKNKALKIALLPQRIAIISVETSKGYADFIKVIETNPWGYKFFHMLFPSLLQGDKAIDAIIGQLRKIKNIESHFDVVAIIRGGGGDIGLSCYNHYLLAKEIALFPLPIITGIGHATNETVSEMISFSNAITPTKLAEYLLQLFHNYSVPVQKAQEKIMYKSMILINDQKMKFQSEVKLFKFVTENILDKKCSEVERQIQTLLQQTHFRFRYENQHILALQVGIRKGKDNFLNKKKEPLNQMAYILKRSVGLHIKTSRSKLCQLTDQVVKDSMMHVSKVQEKITQLSEKLKDRYFQLIKNELNTLNNIENNVSNMSPENVLKRGFSITLSNGKAVKNSQDIAVGSLMETIVSDGKINSIVQSSNNNIHHE